MITSANQIVLMMFSHDNVTAGEQTASKIRSFRNLPRGWHYGQGIAISRDIVEKALSIHSFMLTLGFADTNTFPGVGGEILLTFYYNNHCIEVTIEPNGYYSIIHEKGTETLSSVSETDDPESSLNKMAGEIWSQSGSFTFNIMMPGENVLRAWHSRIHRMGREHPSSNLIASTKEMPRSVNISENFMLKQLARRPSFGSSIQQSFR